MSITARFELAELIGTGATIIVVMIFLAIHTMRKRGITFAEALKQGKSQFMGRPPPPPKRAYSDSYGSTHNDMLKIPPPAAARSGSFSSQGALLQRNDRYVLSKSVCGHLLIPPQFQQPTKQSRSQSCAWNELPTGPATSSQKLSPPQLQRNAIGTSSPRPSPAALPIHPVQVHLRWHIITLPT